MGCVIEFNCIVKQILEIVKLYGWKLEGLDGEALHNHNSWGIGRKENGINNLEIY